MTKKDYIIIAAALKEALNGCDFESEQLGVRIARRRIADALASDNPRFDRERFMRAADIDKDQWACSGM